MMNIACVHPCGETGWATSSLWGNGDPEVAVWCAGGVLVYVFLLHTNGSTPG